MGSGIAAHLANIGFDVTLLDLTAETAEAGIDRAKQGRPPHFYVNATADNIRYGSIEQDLEAVSEADWVCEAIVEDLQAKVQLFERLDRLVSPEAMISTNTSGIEIELLAADRSHGFQERFLGTHFFNPPRYLKLLELIPSKLTSKGAVKAMSHFLENRVARRVVMAKDTPGFIANRFGMWSIFCAIHSAERLRLSVEQVDAITGQFLGRPRSGTFRLSDIIGLDVMASIATNLVERCPDDSHMANYSHPSSFAALLEKGWIGDKAGQGYYKKEGKELVALDLQTMAYRMRQDGEFASLAELGALPIGERIGKALAGLDEVGEYLRLHLVPVLHYANYLKEEICHSVEDFDRVMRWGFGWQLGPFELIDAIGSEKLGLDEKPFYEDGKVRNFEGKYVSIPKENEYRPLTDYQIIEKGDCFNLRDLGDGVTAICLTTKMGTISADTVDALSRTLDDDRIKHFVLTSEAKSFSAGFDLKFFADAISEENMTLILLALTKLQRLGDKINAKPGVAAIFGHCLGAGYELATRCSTVIAHAETQIGLPEAKVGLIPGGAGTVIVRIRNQHLGARGLTEALSRLLSGAVSTTADEARQLGYLRPSDVTCYHPDRLIHDAKLLALSASPREEEAWAQLPGPIGGMIDDMLAQRLKSGDITEYDEQIGHRLKTVFVKPTSYSDGCERERQMFGELCSKNLTLLRIKHMLENGKPLRN
jgi:3-hydroxyacyl-CoA dehydrogenase